MGDHTQHIIDGISQQIQHHLNLAEMESTNPQYDSDKMDDTIKHHRDKAEALRTIRTQLENTFAWVTPRNY